MTSPLSLSLLLALSLLALTATHRSRASAAPTAAGRSTRSVRAGRGLEKRDLSLNQDLKALANLLISREYQRNASFQRNRDFLRKIGKRDNSFIFRLGADEAKRLSRFSLPVGGGYGREDGLRSLAEPLDDDAWAGLFVGEEEGKGDNSALSPSLALLRALVSP